jgi:hypothetical protein
MKPFGKKSVAVAVEPAKLRFRYSQQSKAEPVARKGRFGGRLLFLLVAAPAIGEPFLQGSLS